MRFKTFGKTRIWLLNSWHISSAWFVYSIVITLVSFGHVDFPFNKTLQQSFSVNRYKIPFYLSPVIECIDEDQTSSFYPENNYLVNLFKLNAQIIQGPSFKFVNNMIQGVETVAQAADNKSQYILVR